MVRLLFLLFLMPFCGIAQAIFAHNDYVKPKPFYNAFALKASYIEADVFLRDNDLLVAHDRSELDPSRTLRNMYLDPLAAKTDSLYGLTLMIDLKTEGTPTLTSLVKILAQYPQLTSSKNLSITISGSYPPPTEWNKYPAYIRFDGRAGIQYTPEQLQRITLISTSYGSVSSWNGKGTIPSSDLSKLKKVIDEVHKNGKPVRFWGSPDEPNAWDAFIAAGIDVLNSDHINELSAYLANH
ncbi:MAG TPA: glycerophosphodiester phosphodiesterase [Cyclobacteriaceae bacterium]|nr:glycerophosphodiester phosphodiesterase [Cyclobacteriaceae bacterium]